MPFKTAYCAVSKRTAAKERIKDMTDMMIETQDLSYAYQTEDMETGAVMTDVVLENVNLSIQKGSFTAVLGHNGSGKSTLAKHFNAILLPTGGKVYVAGMDTADEKKLFDIRSTAGMVFQNPDNQMVAAVVEDEVAFAPENLGVEPKEIRRRVDACLKLVGMEEYSGASPARLSGGQKQRVAIAAVLAMEPACIVLDEPTAMLDPQGRKEVLKTIKELNRTQGVTVVLITHYMDEAAQADRVVVIDNGRILMDDVPKRVFRQVDALKAVGLDVPQVTETVQLLRRAGIDIPDDIITVDECVAAIAKLLGGARE